MFWVQETGGKNNSGYRLFYAETNGDTDFLPTNTKIGTQTNGNASDNDKCAIGSECLVIETGSLKILTNNGWVEV